MRIYLNLVCTFLLYYCMVNASNYGDITDNEFAEFEVADGDDIPMEDNAQPESNQYVQEDIPVDDDEEVAIEDESEFEHFQDQDEFEGFETSSEKPVVEPKISITEIPIYFQHNWESYWFEILLLLGLVGYFINLVMGKMKNASIVNAWLQAHISLLQENFVLIGDDTTLENRENGPLVKESDSLYTLWCSGRVCCEGMLVELKLIKRQDLISVIARMMRPVVDQVHVKVIMSKEDMDSFVFCVATKKTASNFSKEMADLSMYCPERRTGDKYNIPSTFSVMSELAEVPSAVLDSKVTAVLNKYTNYIDYIHFSDQYSGVKQLDDNGSLKLPEVQKVLLFGFNMPIKQLGIKESMEQIKPLMTMVIYCMDKMRRFRLSKEGKLKADKNRQRVEEAFLKSTHVARAEAAAARREERKRVEKERVMLEADPDKQRRWEEKEQKRQAKKRAPKMKQLKVKAL